MKFLDESIYNIIKLTRNTNILNVVNLLSNIDNYNLIINNLYLGNVENANNKNFLEEKKIGAILNCTEDIPFNEYYNNKKKYRLYVNDSRDIENINNFKSQILEAVKFIDECLENNIPVYVHCYWGLMRSATVVAAYLIKKYKLSYKDAIVIIKEQRPRAISSIYNFNEVLQYVESTNSE
jgi:protein-tyrosine phosphatase